MPPFGFLTNHGLVMLCIAANPEARMRDIAADLEITERAAQRIVSDLIETGYLERTRVGRRNRYAIRTDLTLALPSRRDLALGTLLNVLVPTGSSQARVDAMPPVPATV